MRGFPFVSTRATGYLYAAMFLNTRAQRYLPDDVCPLGARRVELAGVPRVAAAYVWGEDEPTVLALHGWGADSTTMSAVVQTAVASGETAVCFDAPGHGVSPGSRATITEYAHATRAALRRFSSVHTLVAHSLSSIAAIAAVAEPVTPQVKNVILLAPACSLADVLDRWALQRRLPRTVVTQIRRELERRGGVPVSHWDIRSLGVPSGVSLRLLHDPDDELVPIGDSYRIAAAVGADVHEIHAGTGHHGIVSCDETQAILTACLQSSARQPGPPSMAETRRTGR